MLNENLFLIGPEHIVIELSDDNLLGTLEHANTRATKEQGRIATLPDILNIWRTKPPTPDNRITTLTEEYFSQTPDNEPLSLISHGVGILHDYAQHHNLHDTITPQAAIRDFRTADPGDIENYVLASKTPIILYEQYLERVAAPERYNIVIRGNDARVQGTNRGTIQQIINATPRWNAWIGEQLPNNDLLQHERQYEIIDHLVPKLHDHRDTLWILNATINNSGRWVISNTTPASEPATFYVIIPNK